MKARLRVCWWGPRADHKKVGLLADDAGSQFSYAKEWDDGGALGWEAAPPPAADGAAKKDK